MNYQKELFQMQDLEYRNFHARLMPNIEKERIIGVRVPKVRELAKRVATEPKAILFMQQLPHQYYEEDNLHAFLIEQIKDYNELIKALECFLPYVNNWATCDSMRPRLLYQKKKETIEHVKRWITAKEEYTVRFGIETLMLGFLDKDFFPESARWVANVKREEYYIKMMQAWYFATGLCKRYQDFLPYLQGKELDEWVNNKTVQKAIESRCLSKEQKEEIKKYRR